jgi:signal-transduction protein with cAMP-binding, CBS, and nucleotidyltransferase domain
LQEGRRLVGIATKSDLLHCFTSADSPLVIEQTDSAVSDYMVTDVLQVAPEDATADALHTMKIKRIQHLPVTQNGQLVGMLSDRDILRGAPKNPAFGSSTSLARLLMVRGLMSSEVVTLKPTDTLREAARLMLKHRISALPVCHNANLLGLISETDLLKVIAGPMPVDNTFQF